MNRKMRRELRKDKDLIKGLYSIIVKYLPGLLNMFDNLTDNRNQSNITYKIKNICTTRLFGLLCGLTTMTDISSDKSILIVVLKIYRKYVIKINKNFLKTQIKEVSEHLLNTHISTPSDPNNIETNFQLRFDT